MGSKAYGKKMVQMRDSVYQCQEIANRFSYFMQNEWVND